MQSVSGWQSRQNISNLCVSPDIIWLGALPSLPPQQRPDREKYKRDSIIFIFELPLSASQSVV